MGDKKKSNKTALSPLSVLFRRNGQNALAKRRNRSAIDLRFTDAGFASPPHVESLERPRQSLPAACTDAGPRVVLSEEFYYPEGWGGAQLPRDLTKHLMQAGYAVEVICGSDPYVATNDVDADDDPRDAGVVIRRTPRVFGGDFHKFRLMRQMLFTICCVPLLLFRRRPAVFLTQTNPPLLVPTVAIAALLHRRPFVIIAQDLYPEVMYVHGMVRRGGLRGRLLGQIFRWSYRRAAQVIALGEVMAARLIDKGVPATRIRVISNWATGSVENDPADAERRRAEWELDGHFTIVYAGNIGIPHDVETPIAAMQILLSRSLPVRLVFVGKGSRLRAAEQIAATAGVSHAVQFRPLVPASQMPGTLGLAQVALVTLREGFEGLVVPSKLLGYMGRGLATVYVGPLSDVELTLKRSGGGVCFRNGASVELADGIQSLMEHPERLAAMGNAAAEYYAKNLSRDDGLEKYSRVVAAVVRGAR